MRNIIETKNAMRDLAAKFQTTADNKDLSTAQKKAVFDQIDVDMKAHKNLSLIHI